MKRVQSWHVSILVGGTLALGVLAAPTVTAQRLRLVLLVAVTGCLAWRAFRSTQRRLPWWLLASSMASFSLASGIRLGGWLLGWALPFVDVVVLAGYVLLAAAGWALARTVAERGEKDGLLDGVIVAVAAAAVLTVLLFDPVLWASGPTSRIHLVLGPTVFAAIAGFITRFALLMPDRCWSARLLVSATLCGLAGNFLRTAVVALGEGYWIGSLVDAVLLVAYVLLAVAALHPSSLKLTMAQPRQGAARANVRLTLLGVAMLLPPVILTVEQSPHGRYTAAAMAGLVNLLVLWRLARLFTERERATTKLRTQARRDALTGIANRRALDERLAAALARPQEAPGDGHVALLFCDLDNFKSINDRYGHLAGDEVLMCVARRMRKIVRQGDTLARLSGDEFVVLVEHGNAADVAALASRIKDAVERPVLVGSCDVIPNVSVGVHLTDGSHDPSTLLEAADRAMYAEKRKIRRPVVSP